MESGSYRFHDAAVALNATNAVAPCTLLHAMPRCPGMQRARRRQDVQR